MLTPLALGIGIGPTFSGGFAAPSAIPDTENNLLWEAGGDLLYGANPNDFIVWQ